MYGSRPRQYLDRSELDFDLSLNRNLGGQKFKTDITQLFSKLEVYISALGPDRDLGFSRGHQGYYPHSGTRGVIAVLEVL